MLVICVGKTSCKCKIFTYIPYRIIMNILGLFIQDKGNTINKTIPKYYTDKQFSSKISQTAFTHLHYF